VEVSDTLSCRTAPPRDGTHKRSVGLLSLLWQRCGTDGTMLHPQDGSRMLCPQLGQGEARNSSGVAKSAQLCVYGFGCAM